MSNQKHDSETFIADSGATSHILNLEENMKNLKDAKTQVTVGDSRRPSGIERVNCHGWQKRYGKLHCLTLTNTSVIPGIHANIFSMT